MSIDIRARIDEALWPTDEELPGTAREKLTAILHDWQTFKTIKADLQAIHPNIDRAMGAVLQAYESSKAGALINAPGQLPLPAPAGPPPTPEEPLEDGTGGTSQEDW